jgi:hypothetical protein
LIVIKSDCKEGVNKSNRPIQNPLSFVTESWTRDNKFDVILKIKFRIQKYLQMFNRIGTDYKALTMSIFIVFLQKNITSALLRLSFMLAMHPPCVEFASDHSRLHGRVYFNIITKSKCLGYLRDRDSD